MNEQSNQQPTNQPNGMTAPNWNIPVMSMPWWMNPWMFFGGNNVQRSGGQQNTNPWMIPAQSNPQGNVQSVENQNGGNVQNTPDNSDTANTKVTVPCGIIVEESDIKPADVPMNGGFGMFMKKDLSAIYIKQWQSDGKIYTKMYKEVIEEVPITESNELTTQEILEKTNARFERVEDTLSMLSNALTSIITPNANKSGSSKKKTEVLNDE